MGRRAGSWFTFFAGALWLTACTTAPAEPDGGADASPSLDAGRPADAGGGDGGPGDAGGRDAAARDGSFDGGGATGSDGGSRLDGASDASSPERDAGTDAGPPPFEVRPEHEPGFEIVDGAELAVDSGCQGGTHTYLDVVALGAGLGGATLHIELDGESATFRMQETSSGAELRGLMFVLSYGFSGEPLPRSAHLIVTVTRGDGEEVRVGRDVRLVEGSSCG